MNYLKIVNKTFLILLCVLFISQFVCFHSNEHELYFKNGYDSTSLNSEYKCILYVSGDSFSHRPSYNLNEDGAIMEGIC